MSKVFGGISMIFLDTGYFKALMDDNDIVILKRLTGLI